jgi:hypothetical protein
MALQSSGAISANNINVELGYSGTATITLNDTAARTLAGISSGAIAFSDFYGKSFGTDYWFASATIFNRFEGSNGTQTTAFTDSSSNAVTIRQYGASNDKIKYRRSSGDSVQETWGSITPPAHSPNSPFLPSDYWGIRCSAGSADDATPVYLATSSYPYYTGISGNTFTLEFFYKCDEEGLEFVTDFAAYKYYGGGYILATVVQGYVGPTGGILVGIRDNNLIVKQGGLAAFSDLDWTSKTTVVQSGAMLFGAGKWYHCCIQASGATTKLYIDGIKISTGTAPSSSWVYSSLLPQPPAGTISNIRLVENSNVYTEDGNGNITVPTAALTDITGTIFLTGNGPQFKNYASGASAKAFGSSDSNYVATGIWHSTPVVDSPFTSKTAYSKSTHGGSLFFNAGVSQFPQVLWSSGSSALSNIGGSNSDITIEAWFKRSTPVYGYSGSAYGGSGGSYVPLVFVTYNSNWWGGVYISSSTNPRVVLYIGSGSSSESAYTWTNGDNYAANQWNHLAIVLKYVSSGVHTAYMFINGAPQRYGGTIQTTTVNGIIPSTGASRKVVVGASPKTGEGAAFNYTTGGAYAPISLATDSFHISNVRISNTARYAVTGNFTPSTSPFTSDASTVFLLRGENISSGIPDEQYLSGTGSTFCALSTAQAKAGSSSLQFPSTSTSNPGYFTNTSYSYFDRTFYTANDHEAHASLIKSTVSLGTTSRGSYSGRAGGPVYTGFNLYDRFLKALPGGYTIEFHFYVPSSELSYWGTNTNVSKLLLNNPFTGQNSIALTRVGATSNLYIYSNSSGTFEWKSGTSNYTVAADAWHHVAIVGYGLESRWYVNGNFIGKHSYNSAWGLGQSQYGISFSGVVGNNTDGGNNGTLNSFRGYIDNLRYSTVPRYIATSSTGFTAPSALSTPPTSNVYPVLNTNSTKVVIGGDIFDAGGYRYHVFMSSGKLVNAKSNTVSVDVVCIGGGGGGGGHNYLDYYGGGGGGAGGYATGSYTLPANNYVTVYVGAAGTYGSNSAGGTGGNSYIVNNATGTNWIAAGGGGGGGRTSLNGVNGATQASNGQSPNVSGCGGGGGGGNGSTPSGGTGYTSGGAGGADGAGGGGGGYADPGGAGSDSSNGNSGGGGGGGSIAGTSGMCIQFGGGGGGFGALGGGAGGYYDSLVQIASEGGKDRRLVDQYGAVSNATKCAIWGGGGGGGAFQTSASNGFQGIVIIRYAI